MDAQRTLQTALQLKAGVIWITSPEEVRAEVQAIGVCVSRGYPVQLWSVSHGIVDVRPSEPKTDDTTRDPDAALKRISETMERRVFIMRDLGPFATQAVVHRRLKDLLRVLPTRDKDSSVQVIVLDRALPPPGIEPFVIEWPMPGRDEIGTLIDQLMDLAPDAAKEDVAANGTRDAIIEAALGLTTEQASIALTRSLVEHGQFQPETVAEAKRNAIRGTGLEWYEPDKRGMDGIGGLEMLKGWLVRRRAGLGREGQEWGLPAPKGVLLVGIPGCGKSLTAKCAASAWGVPLLRLDIGSLFAKWVGESEKTVREALRVAETVAPCVLWIDEIEKGGLSGGDGDAGTSSRVFATLLTWMQERLAPVFVVATANDVQKLPPEFLRAGRWDDIFAIDLPHIMEREAIINIMTQKFPHCQDVEPDDIAMASEGYTGAEIEAAFSAALYTAFEAKCEVDTSDVMSQLEDMIPLSVSMKEKVDGLRTWAKGRARPASLQATAPAPARAGQRTVELE